MTIRALPFMMAIRFYMILPSRSKVLYMGVMMVYRVLMRLSGLRGPAAQRQ